METLNRTLMSCKARLNEKYGKQRELKPVEIQLFTLKIKNILLRKKRETFKLWKKSCKRSLKRVDTDRVPPSQTFDNMPAKMMFDSFIKQMNSFQSNAAKSVALARCPRCGNSGLTLLTSSTKDCISPRFMDKIKDLLPHTTIDSLSATQPMNQLRNPKSYAWNEQTEKKITNRRSSKVESKFSLQDISAIPINTEDSYDATHLLSSHNDSGTSHLDRKYSRERYHRHKTSIIPQLDLSDIMNSKPNRSTNIHISTLEGSIPSYKSSMAVLKASPRKTFHDEYYNQGLNMFKDVVYTKLHRVFNLILLSNLNTVRTEEEQSLTFEFSREEIEESRQIENEKLMTGRFRVSPGGVEDMVNISSIDSNFGIKVIEESFSFDYPERASGSWMRKDTINSSAKILYSRLDKLLYRRKVGGFYALLKEVYY
jgi:hypothetical protein